MPKGRPRVIFLESYIGKVFSRLTVISCKPNNRLECLCECGAITQVIVYHLLDNTTRSCGCLHKENAKRAIKIATAAKTLPKWVAARNQVYNRLKNLCRRIGREFCLGIEDFEYLSQKPCNYCGSVVESKTTYHGKFPFNGIDRVDNNLGYVIGNVVPCCKTCNFAKRDMSYQQFIAWIHKASSHLCIQVARGV